MNKNLTEQMNAGIYFCRDGKIRVLLRSDFLGYRKMADAEEMQEKLLKGEDKIHFFYSFLNYNVIFEKGLLFGELINCMKPWAKHIGTLFNINASNFFDHVHDQKDGLVNSKDFKIQISENSFLTRKDKFSKGCHLVKNEDGTYSNKPEEGDFKVSDQSFNIHSEGLNWYIVPKSKKSNQFIWMGLGNMKGLADFEIDFNSDLFLFASKDSGLSFPTTEKDYLFDHEKNKDYHFMLKINKGKFNVSLMEILKNMFSGMSYDLEASEMETDLLINILSDKKEEISNDLKNLYKKRKAEADIFVNETRENIKNENLAIKEFSEDDFNFENSEDFIFADKIYKAKLKEEKL